MTDKQKKTQEQLEMALESFPSPDEKITKPDFSRFNELADRAKESFTSEDLHRLRQIDFSAEI